MIQQWLKAFPLYKEGGCGDPSLPYLEAILLFSLVTYVWDCYLEFRQYRKLKNTNELPSNLTKIVKELDDAREDKKEAGMLERIINKFVAAKAYQLDRALFGFVESIFMQIEGTATLLLGGMPYLWHISIQLADKWAIKGGSKNEYIVSLIFLGLNMIFENVINLPFSLYSTFVIEQRYGFNKSSLSTFAMDKVKAIILSTFIGAPVVSAVLWIIKAGGRNFFFYLWVFVLIFQLIMLTIYPTVIAPLFNKYEPLPDSPLKTSIEALASKVKFPLTKLYVVDGSKRSAHSNAYMYGFFKSKRIVLFDTLLTQVDEQELLSILAHELGHWSLSHTLKMFFAGQAQILCAFYIFSSSMGNQDLFSSFGFASQPTLIGLFLFFQILWSPIDKVLSLLITLWTRYNEFQADEYAVKLGYGQPLMRGLTKLQVENLSNPSPDILYSFWHYSHPPLAERLSAIQLKMKDKKRE